MHSGGSGLILLHILVKHRCETHDLGLCKACLLAHASHTCREVNEITCGRGGVLRQLVDSGTRGKHCATQSLGFVLTEHLGELSDLRYRIFAQVIAQGDIDLVGTIDELLHGCRRCDAQASSILCKLVEFLARRACVYALEVLIHALHLVCSLTCIFADVGHLVIHLGILLHAFLDGEGDAGYGSDEAQDDALHLIEPVGGTTYPRLLRLSLGTHSLQLHTEFLGLLLHLLEGIGASVHATHLLVENLQ